MVLTGAGAIVHAALLWMSPQSALESMLPKLREPWVSQVGIRLQVQVIIIKPGHVSRLQLYSDSTSCLLLVTVSHIIPVSPAITSEEEEENERDRQGQILIFSKRKDRYKYDFIFFMFGVAFVICRPTAFSTAFD